MTNRLQIREIGAWTVLIIAIVLLSVSLAFSQTKTINVENENGKARIKISTTENGVITRFDTTFEVDNDTDIDKIIEQLGESHGEKIVIDKRIQADDSKKSKNEHKLIINMDLPEITEADRQRFHDEMKKSMSEMKNGLKDMEQSLKNMHIRIDNDIDNFKFDFNFPNENHDDGDSEYSKKHSTDLEEMDKLTDNDHFVIAGESEENPPVLEKVVTSKSGKKIFVYKRSNTNTGSRKSEKDADQEFHMPGIENIKYYPNPTDGKITVSFNSTSKNNILIKILDDNNKEVFRENLDNFSGEYSKEIDLSDKSKGNYFLKISSGKKAISRVIVVN